MHHTSNIRHCICCTLRSGLHEIPSMNRTFLCGLENSHACKWISDAFAGKKHIGQHSWKIVSNPFACIVVLQSIGKGPFLFQKVWDIFFSFNTLKYLFPRIREPQKIQICVIPVKLSEIH